MAEIPRTYRQWCHEFHRLGGRAQLNHLTGLLQFTPEQSLSLDSFDLLRMVSLGLLTGAGGELGLTGEGQRIAREHAEALVTG